MKKILNIALLAFICTGAFGQTGDCTANTVGQIIGGMLQAPFLISKLEVEDVVGKVTLEAGLKVRHKLNDRRSEEKQLYTLKVEGAVHIGNVDEDGLDYAHNNALKDVKLFVEDGILTEEMDYVFKEIWDDAWPDYVFAENYQLMDLQQLNAFISDHKHLPGVPSQQDVKSNGVNDKKMGILLLKKVEELILYTIKKEEELIKQQQLNETLLQTLIALENKVQTLKTDPKNN